MKSLYGLWVVLALACSGDDSEEPVMPPSGEGDQVLVFTRTEGFRHGSISDGLQMLELLAEENNFTMTHTESSSVFNTTVLPSYDLVIFLSTTGDVLDPEQEQAFEAYMEEGGNFLGIHAAADTEYDWPWYGDLVGAYFESHPQVQSASINVEANNHPSTSHLPDPWVRTDEWYNFKEVDEGIIVLLSLDENSYEGGTMGSFHPVAWYREFGGGRSFYTALGHTGSTYKDPAFVAHILGGIEYCLGRKPAVIP